MQRHRLIGLRPGMIAVAILALAAAQAGADPVYHLTDLGNVPAPFDTSGYELGQIVYGAEIQTPRIDQSGNITNDRLTLNFDDRTTLDAIQAPYAPGTSGVFPALMGSHYQVGIVGSQSPTSPWQAMLWNNQAQAGQALGPVPGPTAWPGLPISNPPNDSGWYSLASGVNDQGHVVGSVGNGFQSRAAMTWGLTNDGSDPLASIRSQLGSFSEAFGISNQNEIVGTFGSFAHPRAFLFSGGQLIDLNSLLPPNPDLTLLAATGINDLGQVVGVAADASGKSHEFLLTPDPTVVPEPTTLAGFGLLALGLVARHRRRRGTTH